MNNQPANRLFWVNSKPVLFSGIQPTGNLTIGNYAGAIRNWVNLQDEYSSFFCLVDLHALTVIQNPTDFREKCHDFIALYLACGIDPEKSTIFVQSHNPNHSELAWILNCFCSFGELGRMTQFKEKSEKQPKNVNAGLFDYPVLMAADILLYDASLVPVGDDQKQHVELTRDIAMRFNKRFEYTFVVPEVHLPASGARVKNLLDPKRKMDKSNEHANTYIALLDSPEAIQKKIKGAVTGSGRAYMPDNEHSGITNLMTLMSAATGEPMSAIAEAYEGKGYSVFKKDLTDRIVALLIPIQHRFSELKKDEKYIRNVIRDGAEKAKARSEITLRKVTKKLGLILSADRS